MKTYSKTVGELRRFIKGMPDNAEILFRGHPIHMNKTTLDINPRGDGVTMLYSHGCLEIAPPKKTENPNA